METRQQSKWQILRSPDLLWSIAIAAAFLLLMLATPDIPGADDGYRHVKYASKLIRDPFGTFAERWKVIYFWPRPMDAWFGYHFLLAPLTLLFDLVTSAKLLAALVFGGIAFVLLAILKQVGAMWRVPWMLFALAGSGMVLYRSTLTRPFLFSILLVLVVAYFTLKNRPSGVAVASAAHSLSYSMFFMAAFAPAIYLLVRRDRSALKLAASSAIGLAAGILINPTFPENLHFDLVDFFSTLLMGLKLTMELQPLSMEWINPSRAILALWFFAMGRAAWAWRKEQYPTSTWLLIAMSTAAFLASIPVCRTFDYFVPFAALSSAAILSPWIARSPRNRNDAAAAVTVLLVLCGINVFSVYRLMNEVPAANRYRGVSQYLLANDRQAVVFNTQWEQYPFLYYWNSENTYVTGIENAMMYYHDRPHYWLWRHIADDEPATCDRPQCTEGNTRSIDASIAGDFRARYIVVEHEKNQRLGRLLRAAPGFREVYRDNDCSLFAVAASR